MSSPQTPEPETLALAERARVAMHHREVLQLLADIPEHTIATLATLPDEQLTRFLQALRIRVGSLSGLYSAQVRAEAGTPFLLAVRDLLLYYYADPAIQAAALRILADANQSEYYMQAELWRDIASYLLKVANLTGHTELIAQAVFILQRVGERVPAQTGVAYLTSIETAAAAQLLGMSIDVAAVWADCQALSKLMMVSQNHDRGAKAAWTVAEIATAAGELLIAKQARALCRAHTSHLSGGYVSYVAKQVVRRHITAPAKRFTYQGDGQEFGISAITNQFYTT